MLYAQLNTKKCEIGVAAAILVAAAIVGRETLRLGAGWGPSGPQPGFFPLIAAGLMALGAIVVAVRALGTSAKPLYDSQEQCVSVFKVAAPLLVAVAALSYVGFYLMTVLYVAFFTAYYGRYRWYVVAAASLLLPVVLFFAFERGFRISLPKSMWFGDIVNF
jgi:putative tricarboxylic transport membrane protein